MKLINQISELFTNAGAYLNAHNDIPLGMVALYFVLDYLKIFKEYAQFGIAILTLILLIFSVYEKIKTNTNWFKHE